MRRFASPDELWHEAMRVVAELRASGAPAEAADILEAGVRYTSSSGREWLGELRLAARRVLKGYALPGELRARLRAIARAAR